MPTTRIHVDANVKQTKIFSGSTFYLITTIGEGGKSL